MNPTVEIDHVEVLVVDEDACWLVKVPGRTVAEGIEFLEMLGTGAIGSGLRMTQLGRAIPQIRMQYEAELAELFRQKQRMEARVQAGRMSKQEFAQWLFRERRRIAYAARWQQGVGAVALLEARDWAKYGVGGRNWANVHERAARFTPPGSDPLDRIIRTASQPNQAISHAAIRGARLLRRAGPVFVVVGLGLDAHEVYSAPPDQRGDVAARVASEAGGGFLGAGAGVGLCLVFGIASGGWGLLACGAIGGLGGSVAGGQIYRSARPQDAIREIGEQGCVSQGHAQLMPYQ